VAAIEDLSFPSSTGRPMRAALARPADGARRPAVIVIHEIFGLNDDIRRITGRFADLGYVALAPDLFDTGTAERIGQQLTGILEVFAEDLARRAGQAVDNARLYTEQRHIARTLQASLLPPELPSIGGVEVAAVYKAAGEGTEVGGDFYDVFETSRDEWAVVMGDVCGKGPEAAAVTGLARYTIRAAAMRERFAARSERSWKLRFHSQTAGVSLTAQQPYNNVVRTALQALSAVLGGTNSLHTNSLDEALALPTAETATLALRTQQIIAHESGVAHVVDPLGGSYFIEKLTQTMEDEAAGYFEQIDRMGGMVAAIERGFPQQEIAESAYRFQQAVERKEKVIVGVNEFVQSDEPPVEILYIDESASEKQLAKLERLRQTRDHDAVERSLEALRAAARTTANVMPPILDAVRAYATVGEMCDALRGVWGEYEEVPVI